MGKWVKKCVITPSMTDKQTNTDLYNVDVLLLLKNWIWKNQDTKILATINGLNTL